MSDVTPQIELLPQASPDGVTFTFAAERDGIHFEADAHQALGHAVAKVMRELLGA